MVQMYRVCTSVVILRTRQSHKTFFRKSANAKIATAINQKKKSTKSINCKVHFQFDAKDFKDLT